jgi:exodeoxyribonuclease VII small subunit
MSSKPKPAGAELNFESAMNRLEAIVEKMESGKLPLEELIVRYEEGMNLVKICQERLARAEQKIEIIGRDSAGKPVVRDFESAAEAKTDSPKQEFTAADHRPAERATNEDVSLF